MAGRRPGGDGTTFDPDSATAGAGGPPAGWRRTLAALRRDRSALAGLVVVTAVTATAAVTFVDAVVFESLSEIGVVSGLGVEQYWLAKTVWTSPTAETAPALLPPVGLENAAGTGQLAHPLGTDHRGRDILVRLVYGSRVAVQVGVVAALVGTVGGSAVGAVAGYYGGWIDDLLMRGVEVLYAIPFLILVLALVSVVRARGNLGVLTVVVGLVFVPEFARLLRSRVLTVREATYVEAARAAGVADAAIIRRHVLPNSVPTVLVHGTVRVGSAILLVAALSFLGVGVAEPTPSWGGMLATARTVLLRHSWLGVWPGLALLATVVGFTMLGDGLRDALDPNLAR